MSDEDCARCFELLVILTQIVDAIGLIIYGCISLISSDDVAVGLSETCEKSRSVFDKEQEW